MGISILDKIAEQKRIRVDDARRKRPVSTLERECGKPVPLLVKENKSIIAECKKGSPSKGIFLEKYFPADIAREYESGGASAISVITEEDFFFGSVQDLVNVREAVKIPILRKDFVVDEYMIYEAYSIGADAVLLIAEMLDKYALKDFYDCALSLGLSVLVESHDERNLERSLLLEKAFAGINARDLTDFSIDIMRARGLLKIIPPERISVAESGIRSIDDVKSLSQSGFDAFLIGEEFVLSRDRRASVGAFAAAAKGI